jgi:hypothetical protein
MGNCFRQLAGKKISWIYFAVTVGILAIWLMLLLPQRPVVKTLAICGTVWLITGIAIVVASHNRVSRGFSLKRMLISITLLTVGAGSLVLPFGHGLQIGELSIALWFSGGSLIGAGLCSLCKYPGLGAVAGLVIGAFIQGVILWIFIVK